MTGSAASGPKVAVVGASGYAGAELSRLLARHPGVRLTALGADSAVGKAPEELYTALRGLGLPAYRKLGPADLADNALVFLALPHTESLALAGPLLDEGVKVVDLSGDFRLGDGAQYEAFYKHPHDRPDLLKEAVYGLTEIHGAAVAKARLVSNPGCYTTTAILALYPLLRAGLIRPEGLIIDAKSGVSGAGHKLIRSSQFCEIDANFSAYKVAGSHQHIPEIEQELSAAAGVSLKVTFTPHLLPLNRGIFATSYGIAAADTDEAALQACLEDFYRAKPFVRALKGLDMPNLRNVIGTNLIEIAVRFDARAGRVLAFSATDNLLKGAAGQAVQNMNLMLGLPEGAGLDLSALPV
ncbi:MAG: N-acetyl-gamma-glutamyl-phosphate reductase [bacterium]